MTGKEQDDIASIKDRLEEVGIAESKQGLHVVLY